MKLEGKIALDNYPLQNKWRTGCGFGPDERAIMASYGITIEDEELELADFERRIAAEVAKGQVVVFIVPDHLRVNPVTRAMELVTHAWVAAAKGRTFEYMSRAHRVPDPLPPLQLADLYLAVRQRLWPSWKIHALFYAKAS